MVANRYLERAGGGLVLLYGAAHLIVLIGIIATNRDLGRWTFAPAAVLWYAVLVTAGLGWAGWAMRRRDFAVLCIVPPFLTLALIASVPIAVVLGGSTVVLFPFYERYQEGFLPLHLLFALTVSSFALLYRWPRLLSVGAAAQGFLLILYPVWWAWWWQYGEMGAPLFMAALVVGIPLLYGLSFQVLQAPDLRSWRPWIRVGGTVGIVLAAVGVWRSVVDARHLGIATDELSIVLAALVHFLFGALLLPLPTLAWKAAPAEEQERRLPWEVLALSLLVAVGLTMEVLQVFPLTEAVRAAPGGPPPTIWLRALTLARGLFFGVLGLLVPYAVLGFAGTARRRPRPVSLSFPNILLWAGVSWLVARFVYFALPGTLIADVWTVVSPVAVFLPLPGSVFLMITGRLWERRPGGLWGDFWRLATLGGLVAALAWTGAGAWTCGRALFAPFPIWRQRWPDDPALLNALAAGAGVAHLGAFALGLLALGKSFRAWAADTGLGRAVILPALLLSVLGGIGWWITTPPVLHTSPPNGATAVPLDTVIRVEFRDRGWLDTLLGGFSFSQSVRYADTGEFIPGATSGGRDFFSYDPEGLLRPNAPVEVIVRRSGERPFILRFATK